MKLAESFQDADGRLSPTRLAFLAWTLGALGAWFVSSVSHQMFQAIPDSVIWTTGALMTGKAVQSFSEGAQSK